MKTNKKQSLIWWDKRLFFIIIDIAFLYTDWYNDNRNTHNRPAKSKKIRQNCQKLTQFDHHTQKQTS